MVFFIAKIISGVFRIDISIVQRWVTVGVIVVGAIILLVLGLWLRSCLTKQPKLDEKQIQKAQNAIAKQDREEMKQILAESDVAEKQIDENVADAKAEKINAIAEAKKKADAMSNEELAAELERRSKE